MIFQKRAKKFFSTVMSVVLIGGLLLNIGVGGAIAQGSVVTSTKDVLSSIENRLSTKETASDSGNESKQESSKIRETTTVDQENVTMTAPVEAARPNELTTQETQLISVTDSVYLQANDSRGTTLKVLAAAERIRNLKRQLPSIDAVTEVMEYRTANSKHYLMRDGSYQAIISMEDKHFQDEENQWQDTVPFLIEESNIYLFDGKVSKESVRDISALRSESKLNSIQIGKNGERQDAISYYRAPQVPFDVKLPKMFGLGYSLSKKGDSLSFLPIGANSVTSVVYDVNQLNYVNAWDSTDVELSVTENGIKESIILKDNTAPQIFTFQVIGNLAENLSSQQFQIEPSWLVDRDGVYRNVETKIVRKDNITLIEMHPDLQGLNFPIKIDPTVKTVGASINADAYVDSYNPTTNYGTTDLAVGYDSQHTLYSYMNFDLSSVRTKKVTNATLDLVNTRAILGQGCSTTSMSISRVTSPWSESTITYQNRPSDTSVNTAYGNAHCNSTDNTFDITAIAKELINLPSSERYGIVFKPNWSWNYVHVFGAREGWLFTPYLTVTYENELSTAPRVISPNGGEIIDGSYTITWAAATDPDNVQSTLLYDVDYTLNGTNWVSVLKATTSNKPGVTSTTFNFSSVAASTTAYVRVRAYDGSDYSSWDQSDAPFTIQHNRAPNAPSGLNPGSTSSTTPTLVTGITPTLNWTFSDLDTGDAQSACNVLIYNSSNALVYDSGWVTSSAKSFTVPTYKLSRGTVYYWKVQVKDSKGAASPASAALYLKPNTLPTLPQAQYTTDPSVPTQLQFTWTYADFNMQAQSHYQVVGSTDGWQTWSYNSGELLSQASAHQTPSLSSGTWDFALRVKDGMEWSEWKDLQSITLFSDYEPNNSISQAALITYHTDYSTSLSLASDVDYFAYTASATGIDRVTLSVPSGKDFNVHVMNANQQVVAAGDRIYGQSENVIFEVEQDQIYYILVDGVSGSYGDYILRVQPLDLSYSTTYMYDDNGNMIHKQSTLKPVKKNGLLGEYFDGMYDDNVPVFTRQDPTIDFDYGAGAPDDRIMPDYFSVRWTGKITAPYSEDYTFFIRVNGAAKLYVNGQLIAYNSWDNGETVEQYSYPISMVADEKYDIVLEYYDYIGDAEVHLLWSSWSQEMEIVPQSQLFLP